MIKKIFLIFIFLLTFFLLVINGNILKSKTVNISRNIKPKQGISQQIKTISQIEENIKELNIEQEENKLSFENGIQFNSVEAKNAILKQKSSKQESFLINQADFYNFKNRDNNELSMVIANNISVPIVLNENINSNLRPFVLEIDNQYLYFSNIPLILLSEGKPEKSAHLIPTSVLSNASNDSQYKSIYSDYYLSKNNTIKYFTFILNRRNTLFIKDYIDNNLWKANIENHLYCCTNTDVDTNNVFNNILKDFGTPSYINIPKKYLSAVLNDFGNINYDLIYEYNDFAIHFNVSENISRGEQTNHKLTVFMFYYPIEAWTMEKEKFT